MGCNHLAEFSAIHETLITMSKSINYAPTSSQKQDAFGRQRVSASRNLANIVQVDDKLDELIDEEIGGTGSIVYNTGESSTTLSTSADGDYAIRQTLEKYEYQSLRSTQIAITMENFQPETNIIKRVGYFRNNTFGGNHDQDLDGIFLESSNNTFTLKVYNRGTLTQSVDQDDWNVDKLNGFGPSRLTLDKTKILFFFFDFQWLAAGIIRFGFLVNGELITCHFGGNYNQVLYKPYIASPIQPLRWEIRQIGTGSGSFNQVCASITQEGDAVQSKRTHSLSGAGFTTGLGTTNTYALLSLRLRDDKRNNAPRLVSSELLTTTNGPMIWEIRDNPTIANNPTYSSIAESSLEGWFAPDNTYTVTGGNVLLNGLFIDKSSITINLINLGIFNFHEQINGTRHHTTLCVRPLSGTNLNCIAAMSWSEIF